MSSSINRKRTAEVALGVVRAHKFSRVSAAFLDQMEAEHIANVRRRVRELPSKGKTIK